MVTIFFRLDRSVTLKDHTALFCLSSLTHLLEIDRNQSFQLYYYQMVINKSGTHLITRDAGWLLNSTKCML